jgi:hypothetical protein
VPQTETNEFCFRTLRLIGGGAGREKIPTLSAMTLDEVGARLRYDRCGGRPARYYPARQGDAPGYAKGY